MRIIIYTGKGGVGKTSMAAASACEIAARGKKVIVVSTDQAHSLGDSFGKRIGRDPVEIAKNLDAMEIDTVYESEKSWGSMKEYMKRFLTAKGGDGIEVEELLIFPGMEELFSMFRILDLYEEGKYDVVIVDCAPTGETLSLLKYPEKLSGFIATVLPMKRKGLKVAGPAVEKMMKIPMPEDRIFDDFELVLNKMEWLQNLLLNKDIVSLRIVTTPERIVLAEARRNFTCLYLYNYNVDAIIVNRLYPKQAMEGYFSKWMESQQESLQLIKESFFEVPKFYVELQPKELRKYQDLLRVGQEMYADILCEEVLFQKEIYFEKQDGEQVILGVYLPFAKKEELSLSQSKLEVILAFRNEVRRFPLPTKLLNKEIVSAEFKDGYLEISFQ